MGVIIIQPVPQQAQFSVMNQMNAGQMQPKMNNIYNYKTSLCTNFSTGYCKNGTSCLFAHGEQELRQQVHNQQYFYSQQNISNHQQIIMAQMQQQQQYQQQQQQMQQPGQEQDPQLTYNQQLEQLRQQAMLNIIQQLTLILQADPLSINKLQQAAQFIWSQMLDQANILVQEVMNDPKRTDIEIEQYTIIFNQTQDSLNKQQNILLINQQQQQQQQNNTEQSQQSFGKKRRRDDQSNGLDDLQRDDGYWGRNYYREEDQSEATDNSSGVCSPLNIHLLQGDNSHSNHTGYSTPTNKRTTQLDRRNHKKKYKNIDNFDTSILNNLTTQFSLF